MQTRLPTFDDVLAARRRIAAHAIVTPLLENAILNERTGGRVLLKAECLQRVGAFKFRGAYNAVVQIDATAFPGGVVALSSGNHAQGVAEAARLSGIKARIVMPADAPQMKVARTRRSGAEVILYDRESQDREAIARDLCEQHKAALVHPFDDPNIIAGQGTSGIELIEQAQAMGHVLDAVLVCVSGGGFLAGVALAVRQLSPTTEVWAVEPAGFDDFSRSLASGKREKNARMSGSICDSLMSQTPGQITFAIAQTHVAGGVAVSDDDARRAVKFAYEELKLVVEPGGAAGLAAVLCGAFDARGKTVGIMLSGGNVDPAVFASIIA